MTFVKSKILYVKNFDNTWCNTGLYGDDHTMCIYEDSVQASCGKYSLTGIDSQVRQECFSNSISLIIGQINVMIEQLFLYLFSLLTSAGR